MFWVIVAPLYFVLAAVAPSILGLFVNRARPNFRTLSLSLRAVFVVIALICLAATSYVHVDSDEIAVLNKIYGTSSLAGEHIIATNGEKGPQAEILTPGWHPWFLVNFIYQVENKKVISIPTGKYGSLNRPAAISRVTTPARTNGKDKSATIASQGGNSADADHSPAARKNGRKP